MTQKLYLAVLCLLGISLGAYAQEYQITVTNGKAQKNVGLGTEVVTSAPAGTYIMLTANDPNEGESFSKWVVVDGSVTIADVNSNITSFTMPAQDVNIAATYSINAVTATSDAAEIMGYNKETKAPTFTITNDLMCTIADVGFSKMNQSGGWEFFDEPTYSEGSYRIEGRLILDSEYGKTHEFAEDFKFTVDGKAWEHNKPQLTSDGVSSAYFFSTTILIKAPVTSVSATSDISDILGLGKEFKYPTFTMDKGSVAYFDSDLTGWQIKDSDNEWIHFNGDTFIEGTYRVKSQIRIDGENGQKYELADGFRLTVDGKEWVTDGLPSVGETYSCCPVYSPEMIVKEGAGIDEISAGGDSRGDIYNLQGILVRSDASADELRSLPAGIYIVGGKKIFVR